ncbi:MAG: type II toxin-antitoxin system prevent-host-death family antitoxin [Casimicrobiaceae bacterium]|nr:type II toxin-antitoxin system prevent-host-death family antitoxin [Casimicrobiaceae bacterium]MCX8099414.1 type II toxin-antitoxin system prevent-host-death family antitoxin [Casimicrobiaceae bacterium]MDW8311803.1 type II toxin-antitoxin system prevent-host-death family antitoxin [Burkholderiales bacterium]
MTSTTSAEAQARFGELLDRAQREPVQITRHGRVIADVVSSHDMEGLLNVKARREAAARWYADHRARMSATPERSEPTDEALAALIEEARRAG